MSNRKKDKNQSKSKNSKNAFVKDYDEQNNDYYNKNNNNDSIRSLSTMDYIQVTVQKEVQQGLLELARKRPKKPIEFLGQFLVNKSLKKNK